MFQLSSSFEPCPFVETAWLVGAFGKAQIKCADVTPTAAGNVTVGARETSQ